MAQIVEEIMNRELFTLRPDEPVEQARRYLLALGITGAPVVDENGRPLGLLSLRDTLGGPPGARARERMTSPAVTVREDATIPEAAQTLVETRRHRLVVVDEAGRAVGMVSSVDLVAGLLGLPASHPETFPHYDRTTGLTWTDDTPLERSRIDIAPAGPGLLVLVRGGAGEPEQIVWAEATQDLRGRLLDLLTAPQPPPLSEILSRDGLRFRAASAPEEEERRRALAIVAAGKHGRGPRRPRNAGPS